MSNTARLSFQFYSNCNYLVNNISYEGMFDNVYRERKEMRMKNDSEVNFNWVDTRKLQLLHTLTQVDEQSFSAVFFAMQVWFKQEQQLKLLM